MKGFPPLIIQTDANALFWGKPMKRPSVQFGKTKGSGYPQTYPEKLWIRTEIDSLSDLLYPYLVYLVERVQPIAREIPWRKWDDPRAGYGCPDARYR